MGQGALARFDEQASRRAIDGDRQELRHVLRAFGADVAAARGEAAAGRQRGEIRRRARDRLERAAARLRMHDRAQQPGGVGMGGRGEYLVDRSGFHQAAGIHHGDAVGDLAGDAHVMRDENDRHSQFPLQLPKQQQHLDLHGGIERGRGLVGEEKLGSARQRKRDHGALAQAAGQFVRIGIEPSGRGRDLHQLEQIERALARYRARHVLMDAHVLADLLSDREGRVERGRRLLKDHRHQRCHVCRGARAASVPRRRCRRS